MWIVYILISEKDGRRYIGSTNNLDRRINEHNRGRVKSTKHRTPLNVVYTEIYKTEKEARLREKYFKTRRGYNELKKFE